MSSNSSGKKLEGFFTGKGFYIVLFLCAAVIGVSAWMMAAGNETMDDLSKANDVSLENRRVETIILPPETGNETEPVMGGNTAPAEEASALEEAPVMEEAPAAQVQTEGLTQVWNQGEAEAAAPVYAWPVQGELERPHSVDALAYDVTMQDWRTHEGIDISAVLGSTVTAVRSGTVESIVNDDLYGTMLAIDHGDGVRSVYANLSDMPAVNTGDWVDCGSILGTVGSTALCEIGQGTHLHFAIYVDGQSVNPMEYLPA